LRQRSNETTERPAARHKTRWQTADSETSSFSIPGNDPVVHLSLQDLDIKPDFVTLQETRQLLEEVYPDSKDEFVWEEFEQRRRVRRWWLTHRPQRTKDLDGLPPTLQVLVDRALHATNQIAIEILAKHDRLEKEF
jgi:hypothetical protein